MGPAKQAHVFLPDLFGPLIGIVVAAVPNLGQFRIDQEPDPLKCMYAFCHDLSVCFSSARTAASRRCPKRPSTSVAARALHARFLQDRRFSCRSRAGRRSSAWARAHANLDKHRKTETHGKAATNDHPRKSLLYCSYVIM